MSGEAPGSLWTTPANPGLAGIKVDPNVTADDVRAAVAAVQPRAAAFAAPAALDGRMAEALGLLRRMHGYVVSLVEVIGDEMDAEERAELTEDCEEVDAFLAAPAAAAVLSEPTGAVSTDAELLALIWQLAGRACGNRDDLCEALNKIEALAAPGRAAPLQEGK